MQRQPIGTAQIKLRKTGCMDNRESIEHGLLPFGDTTHALVLIRPTAERTSATKNRRSKQPVTR